MNRGRTEGLRFPAIPEREAKAKGCGTADRVANSFLVPPFPPYTWYGHDGDRYQVPHTCAPGFLAQCSRCHQAGQ